MAMPTAAVACPCAAVSSWLSAGRLAGENGASRIVSQLQDLDLSQPAESAPVGQHADKETAGKMQSLCLSEAPKALCWATMPFDLKLHTIRQQLCRLLHA